MFLITAVLIYCRTFMFRHNVGRIWTFIELQQPKCSSTTELPNFYGSQMQLQTGVQSVMPHLHSNFDAFQKYLELYAASTGRRYTTLKGIASDVERNNFVDLSRANKPP
ncbi:hypothetical protein Tco_0396509 [Tanacetum coccineum]